MVVLREAFLSQRGQIFSDLWDQNRGILPLEAVFRQVQWGRDLDIARGIVFYMSHMAWGHLGSPNRSWNMMLGRCKPGIP